MLRLAGMRNCDALRSLSEALPDARASDAAGPRCSSSRPVSADVADPLLAAAHIDACCCTRVSSTAVRDHISSR